MKNFLLILLALISLVLISVPSVHAESFPSIFYCIGDTPGQNCVTRTPSSAPTKCPPPPKCYSSTSGKLICVEPIAGWCGYTPTIQTPTVTSPATAQTSPSVHSPSPATGNGSPAVSPSSPSPSVNPCVAQSATDDVQAFKHHPRMSRGAEQQFIQLLLQLLQLLFQLLGGQIPTPTPTPPPTPSVSPSVSPNPCPSASPSHGPSTAPSTSASPSTTITPSPTIFGTTPPVSPSPSTAPSTAPSLSTGTSPSAAQTSPTVSNTPTPTPALLESNIAAGTSKTNKLCLDAKGNGSANNTVAQTYACNSADKAQKWTPYSDGTIRINGLCLDVNKNGTADRTPVDIFKCNGGKNQQWKLTTITSGAAKGQTELLGVQSNKCLDIKGSSTANSTPLEIFTCNGGNNQAWKWTTATLPPTTGPTQTESGMIKSGMTTATLCLDAKGSGTANGTVVQTYKCNTADKAQQWKAYSDGTIKFGTVCLDVKGQGKTNNTLVDLSACNGQTNQVWTMTNGTLVSKQSGLCLDIKGSSTASPGPQMEIFKCSGGNNQKWSWINGSNTGGGTTKWAYLAPTGLKASNITATGFALSWTKVTGSNPTISGGVPAPSSYTVALYKTNNSLIKQATSTSPSYTATGLPSGSVVVIHVWANGGPLAPPHGVLQVTLATSGGTGTTTQWAYLAPTGLKVTAHTTTSVSLSWTGVTGSNPTIPGGVPKPTGYTIAVYNSSSGKLMKQVTTTTTSSTVSGLTSGAKINVNVWANGGPKAPPHASINNYTL